MSDRTKEVLSIIGFLLFLFVVIAGVVFAAVQEQEAKERQQAAVRNCTATGHQRFEKKDSVSIGMSTSGEIVTTPIKEIVILNEYLCPDGLKRYAE